MPPTSNITPEHHTVINTDNTLWYVHSTCVSLISHCILEILVVCVVYYFPFKLFKQLPPSLSFSHAARTMRNKHLRANLTYTHIHTHTHTQYTHTRWNNNTFSFTRGPHCKYIALIRCYTVSIYYVTFIVLWYSVGCRIHSSQFRLILRSIIYEIFIYSIN